MNNKLIICRDINNQMHEVATEQLIFRPSIYAVIIKDNKILLSRQGDGYDFPGGGINLGESLESALKREVKEETGLEVNMDDLITCENSFFHLLRTGNSFHSIMIYYLGRIIGGELSTEFLDEPERGVLELAEWVDLEEAKNIKFISSADCLKVLKKAMELITQS